MNCSEEYTNTKENELEVNHNELSEMFNHDQTKVDEASKNSISTDNKVLVKKKSNENIASSEGGFGTISGVILIIVAISFILTALLIRMMI